MQHTPCFGNHFLTLCHLEPLVFSMSYTNCIAGLGLTHIPWDHWSFFKIPFFMLLFTFIISCVKLKLVSSYDHVVLADLRAVPPAPGVNYQGREYRLPFPKRRWEIEYPFARKDRPASSSASCKHTAVAKYICGHFLVLALAFYEVKAQILMLYYHRCSFWTLVFNARTGLQRIERPGILHYLLES